MDIAPTRQGTISDDEDISASLIGYRERCFLSISTDYGVGVFLANADVGG